MFVCDKVEEGEKIDFGDFWEGEVGVWEDDWMCSGKKGGVLAVV